MNAPVPTAVVLVSDLEGLKRRAALAADLAAALERLWRATGQTGWHNADPLVSERKRRADLLSEAHALVARYREAVSSES